ncbi:HTH-type transcriptional regulator for conjugative element pMERPH (fragment) [uncultured Stenotrophomonas sp.]|uniref:HTH-type transcriptional regulator for conjugative element pMERPH n=1 Tax=uncultured Stenotrophomonas sp. TaxID=165438 RepID=A0A1Y5Q698_9GAMM
MVNPRGEPSFPPGEKIIVEPEMAATSGSLVVAQIDGEPETTFKKLIIDGGQHLLVPLNPQYVTIQITRATRICGVVISRAEKPLIS